MPLSTSTYGKDNVKFLKIKKDPANPKIQEVIEVSCKVLLVGDFDVSYTKADNSPIVPTDTVKNTVLILAKTQKVWPIERFAANLSSHFLKKYAHVSAVDVEVEQLPWKKYQVDGKLHDHSFIKSGTELRVTKVHQNRAGDFNLTSGLKDLTVLKSTNSMFYGYHQCDFTTLKETKDRILSTDVDAVWTWDPKKVTVANIDTLADGGAFDKTFDSARQTTLDLFATQNSPSVQATMYDMGTEILKNNLLVKDVSYNLPNKHYFLIDLSWKGLSNDNELFYPSWHPNGLIKCTVVREPKAKL
ncbi:hypothetical protein DASC09_028280 [Saccharomycopsis crataegensis]|uniref:Uricase n=1 Tax=Saccharomycopsis crataegensis TaxID=43959 RepID=A0AAV5QMX0_9ASCO|nr:hypothetical protein DASC09_028280 [Saccharomycopsis crataegensis]